MTWPADLLTYCEGRLGGYRAVNQRSSLVRFALLLRDPIQPVRSYSLQSVQVLRGNSGTPLALSSAWQRQPARTRFAESAPVQTSISAIQPVRKHGLECQAVPNRFSLVVLEPKDISGTQPGRIL